MKLSEFQRQYSLHDVPINNFFYFPKESKAILEVELSNDGQWSFFNDGVCESLPINLVFTGVSHYSLNPSPFNFERDEINSIHILPSDSLTKEVMEFTILITPNKGIRIMSIEAKDIFIESKSIVD